MTTELRRYLFTADEVDRMSEAGMFARDVRVELLDGELFELAAPGDPHQSCVDDLTEFFVTALVGRARVRVQGPIRLNERWQPQPDLVILKLPADAYRFRRPQPDDVLLVIEVADTSYADDRNVKLGGYAAAGIQEVWIVNLQAGRIEVYRDPKDGAYQTVIFVEHDGAIAPLVFPDLSLRVGEVIG
jgi:Uma2 family endonuclease